MYDEAEQQNGRIACNYGEFYGAISHGIEAIKRIEKVYLDIFFLFANIC